MVRRTCDGHKEDGQLCRAAPLHHRGYCLMHDPAHADVVAEGRRLGGSRRKKEATVSAAFDFQGTETVEDIRRIVDIAIVDTLALDNGVNRNRTLAYLAHTAVKLLEMSAYASQLADVKAALEPRLVAVKRR